MYSAKTPLRISLFGGSTDHPLFIKKYKKSLVISFASNLSTHVVLFRDKMGRNTYNNKYILNYTSREIISKISQIKNVVIKECFKFHKVPPVSIHLNSDIFSKGSGLAASSSYVLNILKCIYKFRNKRISRYNLIKQALFIERKFNKYCGYQDPFGCEIPGFKIIKTNNDINYKITNLNNNIFDKFNFYLLPTFINRNSETILHNLSKKLNLIYPLYEVAKEAERHIINKDYLKFIKLLKVSWELKRRSSSEILNNNKLIQIDNRLENDKEIISHKLLGAGSGGSFLLITRKNVAINHYKNVIKVDNYEK